METKQLNDEQIGDIHHYIKSAKTIPYDLQMELVDMMACFIEEKWKDDPSLSFSELYTLAIRSIPVTKIAKQKRDLMISTFWKNVWQTFLNTFKLPHILIPVSVWFLLYWIASSGYFESLKELSQVLVIGYMFISAGFIFHARYKNNITHFRTVELLFAQCGFVTFPLQILMTLNLFEVIYYTPVLIASIFNLAGVGIYSVFKTLLKTIKTTRMNYPLALE